MDEKPNTQSLESLDEAIDQDSIVELHPAGDAILIVTAETRKEFRVCTTLLAAASPFFKDLFQLEFSKGSDGATGSCPRVVLGEADQSIMAIILPILHYRYTPASEQLSPRALARVSQHSHKYQCNETLAPWIYQWFNEAKAKKGLSVEDYGLLLAAAHTFKAGEQFKQVSKLAAHQLPQTFASTWKQSDMIRLLPPTAIDILETQIKVACENIRCFVEKGEEAVRALYVNLGGANHTIEGLSCDKCNGILPGDATKCSPCRNKDLLELECTAEQRVAEYFETLRRHSLWPTSGLFMTHDLRRTVKSMNAVAQDQGHKCYGGEGCALKARLGGFSNAAEGVLSGVQRLEFS